MSKRTCRPDGRIFCASIFLLLALSTSTLNAQESVLPSWNDRSCRQDIIAFVKKVTQEGSEQFVPAEDRIAVFDNDGTLWPENPLPFQVAFAIYEVKRLLPQKPEWKDKPVIKALLAGDSTALTKDGMKGLFEILGMTHAGLTTDEFRLRVEDWIEGDLHPRFKKSYVECTYLPMLELLEFLRANGFRTYIVSGGGMEFMRVWAEKAYGIPPEQVIGSYGKLIYQMQEDNPTLTKSLETIFVDDKAGKPEAIHRFIGRRPILAFGNSDGDQQMLQYTAINNHYPSLALLLHHTDPDREYAYDKAPKSSGKLIAALEEAKQRDWLVVDMKRDWETVLGPTPNSR